MVGTMTGPVSGPLDEAEALTGGGSGAGGLNLTGDEGLRVDRAGAASLN